MLKYILYFSILSISSYGETNQSILDSLQRKLAISQEDSNKVKVLFNIAYFYQDNNTDEGFQYAEKAIALSEKLSWDPGLMRSKIYMGRLYWRKGIFSQAITYHTEALRIAESLDHKESIAEITTFIGQDYGDGGNYSNAISYWEKAKALYSDLNDQSNIGTIYLLLSWAYNNQGRIPEASQANLDALRIYDAIKDDYGIAISSTNIASDYMNIGKYWEALPYLHRSIDVLIKNDDYVSLSGTYVSLSDCYLKIGKYVEALQMAKKSLDIGQKIKQDLKIGEAYTAIGAIYLKQNNFPDAATNFTSAIFYQRLVNANLELAANYNNLGICYSRMGDADRAKIALDSAEIFGGQVETRVTISEHLYGRQLYDSLTGNWKSAYMNHFKYVTLRDSLFNEENSGKILSNQLQYEFEKKEVLAKAEQEKKDIRQRNIQYSISVGLAGALIFLVVVSFQRNKISKARKRSDELLLNILPGEVAEELKSKGSSDAKHYDEVTVMFTDFKGFTKISENLSPTELVAEIHDCFQAFDEIIGRHGIEKIKTIGDSYMCAGGLPVANTTHACDVVKAAIEIQGFMKLHTQKRLEDGREIFEVRIGIHSGPVVAGIVGVKKFAYDIWGDTVNIASRIESSGEAGKVNISKKTYQLVGGEFKCTYRGKIAAKNKGEIDMYFVEQSN